MNGRRIRVRSGKPWRRPDGFSVTFADLAASGTDLNSITGWECSEGRTAGGWGSPGRLDVRSDGVYITTVFAGTDDDYARCLQKTWGNTTGKFTLEFAAPAVNKSGGSYVQHAALYLGCSHLSNSAIPDFPLFAELSAYSGGYYVYCGWAGTHFETPVPVQAAMFSLTGKLTVTRSGNLWTPRVDLETDTGTVRTQYVWQPAAVTAAHANNGFAFGLGGTLRAGMVGPRAIKAQVTE